VDAASGQSGPHVLPLPVGIAATGTRTNRDSLGSVAAPAKPCRGALTHPGSGLGRPGADPGPSSGPAGQA
jgi:hypothetical protein